MRISFKEIDDGLINEVFVNDTYIGTIKKNIWNGKWGMRPDFNHYTSRDLIRKVEYDSFYKAGKALAKLYNDSFVFDDDTQEIDMRGIFKRRGP
jgi:hypothetical protein